MLSFYPQFWTQAFDFEGRTSRIDYWKICLLYTSDAADDW